MNNKFGIFMHELIGTMVLILLGDGVVANVVFGTRLFGLPDVGFIAGDWNTIAWGWGMAVAIAVYVAGGLSGAHINPAVTIAGVVRRGLKVSDAVAYILGQMVGAFIGAFLVWAMHWGDFAASGYANVFYTAPASANYGVINAYVSEIIGTAMLLLGIYGLVDADNLSPQSNMVPFMVGILVLAIGLSLGKPTGYAINPARDLGPRIFASFLPGGAADAWSTPAGWSTPYFHVPIIGPIIGGIIGATLYDVTIAPFLSKGE
jgi:glycerol uptake facilitator protein